MVIKLLKSLLRWIQYEFNIHFTSIAKQIEEKIVKPKDKYYKYLNDLITNSIFISNTDSDKVLLVIKELSNSKSAGSDFS